MKFEFKEILNIKIAVQEALERYGTILISLEEKGNTDTHYYNVIKNQYNEHKELFEKVLNYVKNYDEVMKDEN